MTTKHVSRRLSPIQESNRKRPSPRRGSVKRKREDSSELKREASNERRKRLSSEEAWQRVLKGISKRNKENRNTNLKLLKKELKKNKNETMNLLSNKISNVKRKFTFKGLGNPLGIKI